MRFSLPVDGEIDFESGFIRKTIFLPFSQSLVDQLRQWIEPGDTVIDIGAHSGDFSLPLALAAGRRGIVFAWEPNPYVFEVLEKNTRLNTDRTQIIPSKPPPPRTMDLSNSTTPMPAIATEGHLLG